MARGTTGAPRNTPGQDTRNSRAPGFGDPGAERGPARSGGSRLIAFVCGRRSKYLVVVFWILVVAALGGLAGKLQGAEKNDASSYLPASAESTQELNQQNLFQPRTRWWTGYGPRCTGSRAPMPRWAAAPPSIRMSRAPRPMTGIAVALGVLLDTIIVRSVLVTALTLDIGRHICWPSALANPEGSPVTDGT